MPRSASIFIFSVCSLLLPLLACGQTDSVRRVRAVPDSARSFIPTGIRLGTDLISLVRSQTSKEFSGWEVNADVDFYRFFFTADYGAWKSAYELDNGNYESQGTYFRLGADVNFMLKEMDRNMFFLGYRHGHSKYDETATALLPGLFGDYTSSVSNAGTIANWEELTIGLRLKIWKMIWMGYTARLKFRPRIKGEGDLESYSIPGYGLKPLSFNWGFNYQIFVKIPFHPKR